MSHAQYGQRFDTGEVLPPPVGISSDGRSERLVIATDFCMSNPPGCDRLAPPANLSIQVEATLCFT